MVLEDLLKPEYVKYGLKSEKKEDIIKEIADFFAEAIPGLDSADVYQSVKSREDKGSTGLGKGLAIPHGRSEQIDSLYLIVVFEPDGRDFDSPDHQLSNLFFSVYCSDDISPHEELEVLKTVAEIFEKTDLKESVMDCVSAEEVYDLIMKKEREVN